jgi:HCOMODA/2-hydroxy-3-carboxy-muconic semialdehyde decarboxylase
MAPADPAGDVALAADVAVVPRVLARLGFVNAFGHVSARARPAPEWVVDSRSHAPSGSASLPLRGALMLLTPTFPPLGELEAGDVLELDEAGGMVRGEAGRRPLEAALHLAVYAARPEAGAICRLQAPAVTAFATTGAGPPLLHGFGGMVEPVAFWPDPDLVTGEPAAGRVAAALGAAPAMLLAGNGGLTVGADLDQALARAWCLEDRCRVALATGDRARPLDAEAFGRRRRWYDAEEARLARWLRATTR